MIHNYQFDKLPEFDQHEMISYIRDEQTGLKCFVAIHNTKLGPATGGTRMYPYVSEEAALRDVMLLSKAMTYKCALAGVKFGGGKSVIIRNPKRTSEKLLREYGKRINNFGGRFTTGTDVGVTDENAATMARESKYILGQDNGTHKAHTSDMAALGVFYAIQTCLQEHFGTSDMNGKTISIKGLGKIGSELVRLLDGAGATIIAADVDKGAVLAIRKKFKKVTFVSHRDIHKHKSDLYAPCAMGGEFTSKTIKELKTNLIAGGANNQLVSEEIGYRLHEMGILYAPDYVANAGGLINIVDELEDNGYQYPRVQERIENIKQTLHTIFEKSKQDDISPDLIADQMAEQIFLKP